MSNLIGMFKSKNTHFTCESTPKILTSIGECIINTHEYSEKKYARVMKLTRSTYARVEVTIRAGGTVCVMVYTCKMNDSCLT